MAAHAFLVPSSAGSWGPGGCPAYPRMASAYPERGENLAALEGEAAHHWLTETIRGRPCAVGSTAPNGQIITDEMVECGQEMLADMRELIAKPGVEWAVEQVVHMPLIHAENWGRADFIAIDRSERVLYAWDYKFGHGYVDVFENWQLFDYAVGALNLWGPTGFVEAARVDTRIYQPRSFRADGPVKRHEYTWVQFVPLINSLRGAAHEAMKPDAPMVPGSQCTYCPARHACPALRATAGNAADVSLRGVPSELSAGDAGWMLRQVRAARERLEDLETGLEAQVLAAVRAGDMSTGWEVYQGYGRERWTVPADEVIALGVLMGVDVTKPADVITPAQARKAGLDAAVISGYTERPKGELKLRPLDGRAVRRAFG